MKGKRTGEVFYAFFSLISVCYGHSGYILTTPKVLDAGSTEYFTLTLFDTPKGGTIFLRLLKSYSDDVITETKLFTSSPHNMWVEMAIPHILEQTARLQIQGTFNPRSNYQINAIKEVHIRQKSVVTFIQTDKPVYKPGQIVKFRILPVDSQLRPLDGKTVGDIWIEDPSGIRVAQWKDTDFSDDIVQLELFLSNEPVLGNWKINSIIHNVSHSQSFSVEEYVLPKFEVVITPPSYIMADSATISTKICAHYTYGKKVDGVLKALITYQKFAYEKEDKNLPSVEYEGEISGCFSFEVKANDLLLHTQLFGYRTLKFFAEVTENGTEIVQNSTITSEIIHKPLEIKFLGADKGSWYFKPGMPFYGKLQVTSPNYYPAVNEKIEICAHIRNKDAQANEVLCKNFTTDKEGLINFLIPAQDILVFNIILKAKAFYPQTRYNMQGIKIYQPFASISLQAWFSPSGSFLQIEPIVKEVPCGRLEKVKIQYTTEKDSTIKFFHQVISRGRIVQQGSHHRTFYAPKEKKIEHNHNIVLQKIYADESFYPGSYLHSSIEDFNVTLPSYIGEFILSFDARATMSPVARLLVFYVRSDGEVVADSRKFHISNCFQNKVGLHFRHEQQYPNTEATMLLSASPASLCGISVTDKSVHLYKPEQQLDKKKVFQQMEKFDIDKDSLPKQVSKHFCDKRTLLPPAPVTISPDGMFENELIRFRRSSYSYYGHRRHSNYVDSITAFEEAGMIIMSDFLLETRPCNIFPMVPRTYDGLPGIGAPLNIANSYARIPGGDLSKFQNADEDYKISTPKSTVEIRSYFPETWLWELHKIGESGETAFKRELPHTITEWVGHAICIHPKTGLGLSEPSSITTFQPFFVSFSLPYSVIRGESVFIAVTVFNYLTECLPIKLSLEPSEFFKVDSDSRVHKVCVCGEESATHKFLIRPVTLGNINITVYGYSLEHDPICENEITARLSSRDAVTRQLLVEAEGFPREEITNIYFCPKNSNGSFTTEIDLLMPENVVDGSARAFMSVTGDIMGPALNGLEKLIQLPVGCGEQNMVLFTPNIYVLDYLTATAQITEDIKFKALSHLKTGYQRELRYRHADGSFSAFGESDEEGSTWLTAFVAKSFANARRFISIDVSDLSVSIDWLIRRQLENGCFLPVGYILNSGLKGGLSENEQTLAPLAAYVLVSLLEAGYLDDRVTEAAIYCIKSETNTNIYSISLFAYACALAKDSAAEKFLKELEDQAITDGNFMYWNYKNDKAASIEIAGYAILTTLELGGINNLNKAFPIVKWIVQQRNSHGGFVSTQDTVIALQALAAYATFSSSKEGLNIGLAIESDELIHGFKLDNVNKLLTQTIKLPVVPTVVDVQAVGDGCALLQFCLRYNTEAATGSDAFDLNVAVIRNGSFSCNTATIGICMRYKIRGKTSNMAVLEVKMTSGYIPDEQSLLQLQGDKNLLLKRHEISGNQINFYFNELSNEQKCLQFQIKNEIEIQNEKASIIKLYDYYQPDLQVSTSYLIPSTCSYDVMPDIPFLPPIFIDTIDEEDDIKFVQPAIESEFSNHSKIEISKQNFTFSKAGTSFFTDMDDENITVFSPSEIPFTTQEIKEQDIHSSENNDFLKDLKLETTQNASHLENFFTVEDDLDFPDGLEANLPVTVLPPPNFTFSNDLKGCPACLSEFPEDFSEIYCASIIALHIAVENGDTGEIKILHDVSYQHLQPEAINEYGNMLYDKECNCSTLNQNGSIFFLFGNPKNFWTVSNGKHNLKITSDFYIISSDEDENFAQIKAVQSFCDL